MGDAGPRWRCIVSRLPVPYTVASAGPFQGEDQARAIPAVRAANDAARASSRRCELAQHSHKMICAALTDRGVDVGEYDHRLVGRL